MTGRDDWARLTPYEVGIPGREFADENFRTIREEAESRGVDDTDPGAFIMLGQVGRVLREIQGEEDRGGEAVQRFGSFLFHAYHFHRAGEPLILMQTDVARYLVEGSPAPEGWAGQLPEPAGYLQLPRHLFWSRQGAGEAASEGADPAEPVDGIFWARSVGDTVSLLVAMGVRGDRPGISVVALPPLPLGQAPLWTGEPVREEGRDFETTLPGGDLDRLYSVETLGEALKLWALAMWYTQGVPGVLGEGERSPRTGDLPDDHGGPVPSILPFRRMRLVGEGG
jgi:hypothetical protein